MKKEEAAKLIAKKTHAIYNDNNDFIGSTSKTKPLKISFNENGYLDLQSQESIKFYFYCMMG